MTVSRETAAKWWSGIVASLLVMILSGVGAILWTGVQDGRDSRPKIEAIEKRLGAIEVAAKETEKSVSDIRGKLDWALMQRVEELGRRITNLENARSEQDRLTSDLRAELSGMRATLQEILRASTSTRAR